MDEITITYRKEFDAEPKERKHIILMDGTWNDETGKGADMLVTNIVRLSQILQDDDENQIVRYHRGVGNDNENGFFKTWWKGATGKAVHEIVDNAYARFVQDWQKGDRIYIFGFSRGAAGARLLASKIAKEQVPTEVKITIVPKQNKESKVVEQRIKKVDFDTSRREPVEIEFLGVWDTVSAFGFANNIRRFFNLAKKDLFSDNHIAPNIQKAVHLVAIDETRNIFVPSLMNHKEDVTHEVWFPGVHSDIGGSYAEDDLARASLFYMLKCMEEWNNRRDLKEFLIDNQARTEYAKEKIEKAHFHFHGKALGKDLRPIRVQVNGQASERSPSIHRLYYDIVTRKNSYSVFKKKTDLDKSAKKIVKFQYMPFNVKVLRRNYEIVD
ncbi:MAG: DUF2235 domain-containing protein [Bacteroidota bacterium]